MVEEHERVRWKEAGAGGGAKDGVEHDGKG